ncbi:TA2R9 protein, partial [Calyptomena viridis]|nr:TA2R9 protein [Calyptomena viridis]
SEEQTNATSFGAMSMAIMTLEVFAGMWINAFVVCVLCISWIKKKTLNSNEKILLLLGCSRFWYLFTSWVYSFLLIIYTNYLYVQATYTLLLSMQGFFECSDLWFSACLCVFYCIKVANFRNRFFFYLKVKIDRIVPWLLLGSVILALNISILTYDITGKAHCNNSTGRANFSKVSIKMEDGFFPTYFIYGFGYITSFTAVIFSALLLLFSLWRHKCNMQTNSMKDLSVDAHIRAMKSILSFLVMYSINFISLMLSLIFWMKEENLMLFLIYIFLYAFPGVHSLILIFSNPRLQKTMLKLLPFVKCKVCMR